MKRNNNNAIVNASPFTINRSFDAIIDYVTHEIGKNLDEMRLRCIIFI